ADCRHRVRRHASALAGDDCDHQFTERVFAIGLAETGNAGQALTGTNSEDFVAVAVFEHAEPPVATAEPAADVAVNHASPLGQLGHLVSHCHRLIELGLLRLGPIVIVLLVIGSALQDDFGSLLHQLFGIHAADFGGAWKLDTVN